MVSERRPQAPRELLARYHAELVSLIPAEERDKYRVRLGAGLVEPFLDSLGGQALTAEELKPRLEAYLRDELQMADSAQIMLEGDKLQVEIRGCHLCFGNDRLRAKGQQGFCPYAPGLNRAVSKALQQGTQLQGVDKSTGVVGECTLQYEIHGGS